MTNHHPNGNPAVLSYHEMRKYVGYIAIGLPVLLSGGYIVLALIGPPHVMPKPPIESSISAYYYTVSGKFLVGGLCAIAMFLISCRGYDRKDEYAGYLAGLFALGVAFCPIVNPCLANPGALAKAIDTAHTTFAALMFLILAYFCLCLFRKTSPGLKPTRRKLSRNVVYTVCGWTIVGCMAVMVSLHIGDVKQFLQPIDPLFCFETLSLLAFGVAWLTKGEGFLKDD